MKITMQSEQYGVSVTFRREDGYPAERNARLLIDKIDKAGDAAAALAGYEIVLCADGAPTGNYDVAVEGKRILASASGILTQQYVLRYFDELIESGKAPASTSGTVAEVFADSNRYAFDRKGDHRVMFYNVLWDNGFMQAAWERNIMTAHIVREFSPAVVGLQECGKRKRAECFMYDIARMMNNVGYVETPVEVKNEYHNVNCTPLFYDPEQVNYLDGAYVWYSLQCQDANVHPMDRSSKSFTWGLFEDKKTGERYIVSSTHMCTQKDDIREIQAREACEIYAQLKEKYNVPILLGGDFNALPTSKGFGYYRAQGYPSAYETATLDTCDTKTYHPYPEYNAELRMVMKTADAELHAPEKCIDHILYPYKPEGFETRVYGVVINDFTLAASDHFPIFADFCVR